MCLAAFLPEGSELGFRLPANERSSSVELSPTTVLHWGGQNCAQETEGYQSGCVWFTEKLSLQIGLAGMTMHPLLADDCKCSLCHPYNHGLITD